MIHSSVTLKRFAFKVVVDNNFFIEFQVFLMYMTVLLNGWSGGNMGPRPLGPRRNRWAACASRQS